MKVQTAFVAAFARPKPGVYPYLWRADVIRHAPIGMEAAGIEFINDDAPEVRLRSSARQGSGLRSEGEASLL